MFDFINSATDQLNRLILILLLCILISLCVFLILILNCTLIGIKMFMKRFKNQPPQGQQGQGQGGGRGECVIIDEDELHPTSILFQFPTDDLSLLQATQSIQSCRYTEIIKKVHETVLIEAIQQRTLQLNPAKASENEPPSDEIIFGLQLLLLRFSRNQVFESRNMTELDVHFLINILRVQKLVDHIWAVLDAREQELLVNNRNGSSSTSSSIHVLRFIERWICRLLLEANISIDNLIAGHQLHPDMMCALAYIDPPSFFGHHENILFTSRRDEYNEEERRRRNNAVADGGLPPNFETLMYMNNAAIWNYKNKNDAPHLDLPPSYNACVLGQNDDDDDDDDNVFAET